MLCIKIFKYPLYVFFTIAGSGITKIKKWIYFQTTSGLVYDLQDLEQKVTIDE